MQKQSYQLFGRKTLKTVAIIVSSMTVAFVIGIETAGDVQPIVAPTRAGGTMIEGDFNNDGKVTVQDVRIALEIVQGNRVALPHDLEVDPNQDFHITIDDVAAMLYSIELSTQQ